MRQISFYDEDMPQWPPKWTFGKLGHINHGNGVIIHVQDLLSEPYGKAFWQLQSEPNTVHDFLPAQHKPGSIFYEQSISKAAWVKFDQYLAGFYLQYHDLSSIDEAESPFFRLLKLVYDMPMNAHRLQDMFAITRAYMKQSPSIRVSG